MIRMVDSVETSLLFCNGTLGMVAKAKASVILVRGKFGKLVEAQQSFVECSHPERCRIDRSEKSTYVNWPEFPKEGVDDRFRTIRPSLVDCVRFFDPWKLGLSYAMVDGDAEVDRVGPDEAVAAASLGSGDRILSIDRTKFVDERGFVSLLRRSVAAGQAVFKVEPATLVRNVAVTFVARREDGMASSSPVPKKARLPAAVSGTELRIDDEGVDRFIDRMVRDEGYATDARWKGAVELARQLSNRLANEGAPVPKDPVPDVLRLPIQTKLVSGGVADKRVLVSESPNLNVLQDTVFISSGPVKWINGLGRSILFINGDMEGVNSAKDSIVICNGTIRLLNGAEDCIIVADGVINGFNSVERCSISVRGIDSFNVIRRSLVETVSSKTIDGAAQHCTFVNPIEMPSKGRENRARSIDPTFFSEVRFFYPSRMGIAYTMVDGDVRVDEIAKESSFAAADLRAGDLVLAVDGQKFVTDGEFTDLLRPKITSGQTLLKVQRGDRILEIPVKFRE
jgi:hypothetical protein